MESAREMEKKFALKAAIAKAERERAVVRSPVEAEFWRVAGEQSERADAVLEDKVKDWNERYKNFPVNDIIGEERKAEVEFRRVEGKDGLELLKPRDHRVLLHWIEGMSYKEIARILDLSPDTVSKIVQKDAFKVAYNELMAGSAGASRQSQQFLEYNTAPAARKLAWLRDNAKSEAVQLRAATEILDRGNVPQVKRTESFGYNVRHNLEGYPEDYKKTLIERRLSEINEARRKRLDDKGGDVGGGDFEIPQIVVGEIMQDQIEWQEAEFGESQLRGPDEEARRNVQESKRDVGY